MTRNIFILIIYIASPSCNVRVWQWVLEKGSWILVELRKEFQYMELWNIGKALFKSSISSATVTLIFYRKSPTVQDGTG